jgi:hypothetical protein
MTEDQQQEAFVSQQDRPDVKIDPSTPVSELRVRDLQSILGGAAGKKVEKYEIKELKLEKLEWKEHKLEWKEHKFEKIEIKEHKFEKFEWKDHKFEKLEREPVVKQIAEPGPDPTQQIDPGVLQQVIESVASLRAEVSQLTDQIREMESG